MATNLAFTSQIVKILGQSILPRVAVGILTPVYLPELVILRGGTRQTVYVPDTCHVLHVQGMLCTDGMISIEDSTPPRMDLIFGQT